MCEKSVEECVQIWQGMGTKNAPWPKISRGRVQDSQPAEEDEAGRDRYSGEQDQQSSYKSLESRK